MTLRQVSTPALRATRARTGRSTSRWHANGIPWVRAQGAHCGTVCTRTICKAWACPLASPPRRLLAIGPPKALPLARAQAVLLCAPCARTNGRVMALPLAIAKRQWPAGEMDGEGEARSTQPFPSLPSLPPFYRAIRGKAGGLPTCLLPSLPLYFPPWEDCRNSTTDHPSST